MNENNRLLYIIAAIGGLALLALMYAPSPATDAPVPTMPETAPRPEDGAPPALSSLPFHMSFIDEETCLKCHLEPRQINLKGEIMETPVIAHELRDDCTACHQIPRGM